LVKAIRVGVRNSPKSRGTPTRVISRGVAAPMDSLLRALSVAERGLAQMNKSDKACSIMEWNDDQQSSFAEIKATLLEVDI
jgi:hypothetical protein